MKIKLATVLISILLLSISLVSFGQVLIKKVKPSDTDSNISTFNNDSNYVYFNQNILSKNLLVVHLPGSYGTPKRASLFGTLAANLGFHSVGLMYPNIPTISSICSDSNDSSCYEMVRKEIITGVDYSQDISIDTTECIINRVEKLLIYLKTNYPNENWGQYLDTNNNLIYSKIIFSGHSQGGGHATIIAKYYPIKRAICFSSPKDYSTYFNKPAFWFSSNNWQTSKSEIYTSEHTSDGYTRQLEILDNLGLGNYGLPINVDNNTSPYNNTLQLITSYSVSAGSEHGCTLTDNKTPIISGSPVFLPVWTYMLTNNISTEIVNNSFANKIDIYPNPTNRQVKINYPNNYKNIEITIYTVLGEKILEFKNQSEFSVNSLVNGIYIVQIKIDKKTIVKKLLKK